MRTANRNTTGGERLDVKRLDVKRLDGEFYRQSAVVAAPALLGKLLCRAEGGGAVERRRITETECYYGGEDTACHARAGKTPRTAVMYRDGGAAYVYLCYGIHFMLNIVTGHEGHPEAVLIRGVEGARGPGNVSKCMRIDKTLNGEDLTASDRLWLEDDGYVPPAYSSAPRIGINYASAADRARLWRYTAEERGAEGGEPRNKIGQSRINMG
jgi:DNA-3-methyladenine glycosylase